MIDFSQFSITQNEVKTEYDIFCRYFQNDLSIQYLSSKILDNPHFQLKSNETMINFAKFPFSKRIKFNKFINIHFLELMIMKHDDIINKLKRLEVYLFYSFILFI